MVISIMLIFVTIPTLFKEFTDAICHDPDQPLQVNTALISRARNLRVSLHDWHHTYIRSSETPTHDLTSGSMYYDALVIYYICMIYSSRLNTCIHSQDIPSVYKIEEECQWFAKIIVSLHQRGGLSSNRQGSLLLAQKLPIAEATIESGDAWKAQLSLGYSHSHVFKMPRETFHYWCKLFGRRIS
jgi:hypothetical protein